MAISKISLLCIINIQQENTDGCISQQVFTITNSELAEGPLMLQGGMGAVAYRHIRITVPGQ